MRKALLGVTLALGLAPAAPAATGHARILYAGDWSGDTEIYAVDPAGKQPVAQLTHWDGACSPLPDTIGDLKPIDLVPSPDGRHLLVRCGTALWFMRANGAAARQLVPPRGAYPDTGGVVGAPVWTHDSKQFAYPLTDSVHIVDVATGSDRVADDQDLRLISWHPAALLSPDRRWVANVQKPGILVFRTKGGSPYAKFPQAFAAAWSPNGKWLAIESRVGIRVFNIRTRHLRTLTRDVAFGAPPVKYERELFFGFAWAPDGRSITYVPGRELTGSGSWSIVTGGLETVTLTGKKRTVVATDRAYGGRMTAAAWTRTPPGTHYGAPDAKPTDPVSSTGVLADGRIELLAADGPNVAFESCNRIVVWTPSTSSIDPVGSVMTTTTSSCVYPETTGRYLRYDLALAGDRLVYALSEGCNSIEVSLHLQTLSPLSGDDQIANGWGNCGGPFDPAVGRVVGSGGLLVYGEWTETATPYPPPPFHFTTTHAAVRRVDGVACPCPVVASTSGPLYPADVDGGRIVAYGDNETLLLDRDGNSLLRLPISPLAAQLSETHLILLVRGQLRDYDARDGSLLHTWAVPDVPSGPVCAWRTCDPNRFVLADAADGLVAYILDGKLHVLRLVDGADSLVGRASLARFMDEGLVYADGSRLHLARFSQLPLRAF
jgi:hypothetical protein